ncbi:MAG: phosphate ABC transporter permease subunit PstC [Bauldia sp.]|nr:phosphate ABC transporter permease subunit PstC [Bauldia sp.]
MSSLLVVVVLLALISIGYRVGLSRSRRRSRDEGTKLHSRSNYHGALVAIWCVIPALLVLILWTAFSGPLTRGYLIGQFPDELAVLSGTQIDAQIRRVEQIADGIVVAGQPEEWEIRAAENLTSFKGLTSIAAIALAAIAGAAGLWYARSRIAPRMRARNEVERVVNVLLLVSSGIAILTTVGIVISLLGEALRFFTFVSPVDFFFGTRWSPTFSSTESGAFGDYGLLPLLSGTIMISIIAMLVALPIGLMTAIFMAEYAPRWVRQFAKPVIEILAGIPTIVYGFFALVTVGPFLREFGESIGINISATSALTAGVVMGVMIIPFISSLSDDIITQVPRSLRDGSYGLGATRSETIRRVLLPAALPGIVGAFLLAVSRAIGETMIVVLAAGNAPVLRANPLEPASTMTVSIVNQLTGDTDFESPQSLVAFALGLTLFAMTLILNVVALYIVRRFREQYD